VTYERCLYFARKLELLAQDDRIKHLDKFFIKLGKDKHFRYDVLIPTLVKLAGRENVLIHRLSMDGGDIALHSVDEGAILHPRDEAIRLCYRA
jgi:hypothetical protein